MMGGGPKPGDRKPGGAGEEPLDQRTDADAPHDAPEGSFSRIFLGNLEKYRKTSLTEDFASPTQEAAAQLARRPAPKTSALAHLSAFAALRLRSRRAMLESLAITLSLPAVGWLLHRSDPFFLSHRFSWLAIPPLLIGLRHGFTLAFASAIALDLMVVVAWRSHLGTVAALPGELLVGLVAMAMLCGQFSDVWKREVVRLDDGFDLLRKQINELSRSHFLLELSHDRLQEQQSRETANLRDALVGVRRLASSRGPGLTLGDVADPILEIFATHCMLEIASMCSVAGGALGPPVAALGRSVPVDPGDPLVRRALKTGMLAFLPTGSSQREQQLVARTKLLAAIPLVDAWQETRGVVCIEAMPFTAFERHNLEALAVLAGHFADILAIGGAPSGLEKGRRQEYEVRLTRALRDLVAYQIPSTVFGLTLRRGSAASDAIEMFLGGSLRELDFPLVLRDGAGNYAVLILLPLTDETGAKALANRFERMGRQELGMELSRAGAFHFFHVLRSHDTPEGVMRMVDQKAHIDEAAVEVTICV